MRKPIERIVPIGNIYMRRSVLEKGNIAGVDEDRTAWAKDLNLPSSAEYIFFAGCGYQFMRYAEAMTEAAKALHKAGIKTDKAISMKIGTDKFFSKIGVDLSTITAKVAAVGKKDTYSNIIGSAVRVLQKLGLNLGYMYQDEPCCGSPLYYGGFLSDYIKMANKNHNIFRSLGIQKVISLIPACTSSLRNLYPKYVEDYGLEVLHFTEVVAQKIKTAKAKPRISRDLKITYHDPCQLSRYLNIVEEPREILRSIERIELREPQLEQCRQWSTCCGGGGLEANFPDLSERLGLRRVEELLSTGANTIVSHCPACVMQLKRSIRKLKADVMVMDLVELLDEALE